MSLFKFSNDISGQTFLEYVAAMAVKNHKDGNDLYRQVFVFPSKRAGHFFIHELSRLYGGKPFISPEIMTSDEFVGRLTPLESMDQIALLFKIFAVYEEVLGEQAKAFDDFVYWGDMMLRDFSDVDRYLVDAKEIFTNVKDLKEITADPSEYLTEEQKKAINSFWNVVRERSGNEKDRSKEDFMDFFHKLYEIYDRLKKSLFLESGKGSQGMIYRHVAEAFVLRKGGMSDGSDLPEEEQKLFESTIRRIDKAVENFDHIYFVGLFGLSKSEVKIFASIKELLGERVHFIWDASGEVAQDKRNPVSRIVQANLDALGGELFRFIPKDGVKKELTVYSLPSNIGQSRLLPSLLEQMLPETAEGTDLEEIRLDTLIMPSDEKLLFPIVSSLGDRFSSLNITMGYPIGNTSVASLIALWLEMQIEISRHELRVKSSSPNADTYWISAPTIINIMSHPLIVNHKGFRSMRDRETSKAKGDMTGGSDWSFVKFLAEKNMYYVYQDVIPMDTELAKLLFLPAYKNEEGEIDNLSILKRAGDLLKVLVDYLLTQDKDVEKSTEVKDKEQEKEKEPISLLRLNAEFAAKYYQVIMRIEDLCHELNLKNIMLETLVGMILEQVSLVSYPFTGEPLKGLQLMGKLETRCLSFKNQILLSAADGILPKSSSVTTLIPYNIRFGYGLPTIENTQITEAYHFFRLVSTAENLAMIYDSRVSYTNTGEESRYIKQLEHIYGYKINRRQISMFGIVDNAPVKRQKTLEVCRKLAMFIEEYRDKAFVTDQDMTEDKWKKKALSATVINQFVACPLKFYLNKVKGINVMEDPDEMIVGGAFGTMLHEVMRTIYDRMTKEGKEEVPVSPASLSAYLEKDYPRIRKLVDEQYKRFFGLEHHDLTDYARLTTDLIVSYVANILKYDIELAKKNELRYIASEEDVHAYMPIKLRGEIWSEIFKELPKDENGEIEVHVKLKGSIDRVDKVKVDGTDCIRIVDYKTESFDSGKLHFRVENFYAVDKDSAQINKVVDQVLLYCYIKKMQSRPSIPIRGAVYAVRMLSRKDNTYDPEYTFLQLDEGGGRTKVSRLINYSEIEDEYEKQLKARLEQIFNNDPKYEDGSDAERLEEKDLYRYVYESDKFNQTDGESACEYCDFKMLCGR